MSNIFKVDDSKINLQRGSYKLDTDLYAGFMKAANNNQMYLAFEYLTFMMEIINERLNDRDISVVPPEADWVEAAVADSPVIEVKVPKTKFQKAETIEE